MTGSKVYRIVEETSGERILARLHPHPLAFAGDMALWIYTILVSALLWAERASIAGALEGLPLLGRLAPLMEEGWGVIPLISIAVLAPTIIYSLFKVTWRPIAQAALAVVVAPLAAWKLGYQPEHGLASIILVSLLGLAGVELSRRRHIYIVTDRRIRTIYRGLLRESQRDIVYSRLSDVVVEKGLLGKIFGFGDVYIISQASLGMGSDAAGIAVGGGVASGGAGIGAAVGGGRTVNVPRSRPQYVLHGVPDPEKVTEAIVEAVKASEEAPYLRRILEKLDEK